MPERYFDTEVLGFSQLLGMLAGRARMETTRRLILALSPFSQVDDLQSDLDTLAEYQALAVTGVSFVAEELPDMTPLFQTLAIEGACLSPEEILAFRRLLSMVESHAFLFQTIQSSHEMYPHLYSLCANMKDYPQVRKRIDEILSSEGEIYEQASPALVDIRQKKYTIRKTIQQRLEEFISDPLVADFLQDRFVTVKEGRFVLPIKVSLKNVFQREYQAILHSYSQSGETVYMEPAFIVDANNEVLEIEEQETQEMWRLMGELTTILREVREELSLAFDLFSSWEWLHIRFLFWKEFEAVIPRICPSPGISLRGVRHPFLGKQAVPVDILLDGYQALIISGPNAGGKTVSLKTTGLCTLMGMCGIPVPAREATIGVFHQVYAEIGDEQNLERALSSFTGQVTRLQQIWEKADGRTLVLIDEIAHNTDPREGEALARAYIQALLARGAMVVVTTHYHGLKELAYEDTRIQNASVLFDRERLKPLYTLQYGEFSMSFALDIARRHGLDSSIVEMASRYLETTLSPTEKMLFDIEKQKQQLAVKQQEIEKQLSDLRQREKSYQQRLREIEERERAWKEKQLEKLGQDLLALREEMAQLREKIKTQAVTPSDLEKTADSLEKRIQQGYRTLYRPLKNPVVGQTVFVPSFQTTGVLEAIQREKARVRIGGMSLVIALSDLYATDEPSRPVSSSPSPVSSRPAGGGTITIDVRGKTVEECLKEVARAVDKAIVEGASTLAIIHGIGEGILQRAIHDFLSGQKGIETYTFAPYHEGGKGKTIVTFK